MPQSSGRLRNQMTECIPHTTRKIEGLRIPLFILLIGSPESTTQKS